MSIEAFWYSSFRDGKPPVCRRASRLPMQQQWEMAIDLAIALESAIASYRQATITRTGETYVYWPDHPLSRSGWWLIPPRIGQRATRLRQMALIQNAEPRAPRGDIVEILWRWKRTDQWRQYVWDISPHIAMWLPKSKRLPKSQRMEPPHMQSLRIRTLHLRLTEISAMERSRIRLQNLEKRFQVRWIKQEEAHWA